MFDIVENKKMLPVIDLDVFKDQEIIEQIRLEMKPFFIFGAHPSKSNIILRHASISRCHAAIIIDQSSGVLLLDLNSKAKTFINGKPLTSLLSQKLQNGDEIQFGQSTRKYKVKSIDYSRIQNQVEKESKELERELNILKQIEGDG